MGSCFPSSRLFVWDFTYALVLMFIYYIHKFVVGKGIVFGRICDRLSVEKTTNLTVGFPRYLHAAAGVVAKSRSYQFTVKSL